MDVEEIRTQLARLEERLDIDADIIEYLIRDIFYADKFYTIGEGICGDIADDFISKLKLGLSMKNAEKYSPKTKFKDSHCILFISPSGDEEELIEIAGIAKEKDSFIYVVCSDRYSPLASFANEFIHIKDKNSFIEDSEYLLSTIYDRLEYYTNSREYAVANPHALTLESTKKLLNMPDSSVMVSNKQIVSHLEIKKQENESLIPSFLLIFFFLIILILIFKGIIYLISLLLGFPYDFKEHLIDYTIFSFIISLVSILVLKFNI